MSIDDGPVPTIDIGAEENTASFNGGYDDHSEPWRKVSEDGPVMVHPSSHDSIDVTEWARRHFDDDDDDDDDTGSGRHLDSIDFSIASGSSFGDSGSSPLAETIAILLSLQEDLFPGPARPPSTNITKKHPPQERLQWCIANLAELAVKEYADYEIQQMAHNKLEEMQQNHEIDENVVRWVEGAYSRNPTKPRTSKSLRSKRSRPSIGTPLFKRRMSVSHVQVASPKNRPEADWLEQGHEQEQEQENPQANLRPSTAPSADAGRKLSLSSVSDVSGPSSSPTASVNDPICTLAVDLHSMLIGGMA